MDLHILDHLKVVMVLGPVLGLLLVGLFISLQSEVTNLTSPGGVRLFLANVSGVLLRVVGYVVALVAVQYAVGFPMGFAW